MNKEIFQRNKESVIALSKAMYDYEPCAVRDILTNLFSPDAEIHLCHPLGDKTGPNALFHEALTPLQKAIPDLERRDTIIMSGPSRLNSDWVGCCGYYTGTFTNAWLDIPATGHQVAMRFHEFFRFEHGQIVEMQAIWDIPEVMMQAGAWPMVPSLGREWHVPGPATLDGINTAPYSEELSEGCLQLVTDMCNSLGNYAEQGAEGMELEKYWHPKSNWYGPSGIGTGRGIAGFRNWHQIPFLNALPDRVGDVEKGYPFADGNYVAFTAWPGMHMTVSGDGWLGIAAADQKITMRSLDFWRCENDLIRENWVLIDLLHVYDQLGVDVFARMREFNKARRNYNN